jgi:DNA helicase-2/ATP-dependent DNA helicase PcrA
VQNYLNELNSAQREAVTSTEGATLVIAGAGSGKTRVLTYRIAHLLKNGVPPWSILALTFTNKAAKEMKERIASVVGNDVASRLWMGTFHSIFARILRTEADLLKYPKSFTIYDSADSKSLIKSIVKEMKLVEKEYKPGEVLSRISSAKNDLVLPPAYARDQHRIMADKASRKPLISEIYQRYMKACFNAGAMDFDDLLLNTNLLFRDFPEVLAKYQNSFRYILVDEYQDTNFSQYLIVRKLAEKHQNVCVVGDDAQSIYSFRGAKIENILNFRNDYPGYKIFKLEQNYRSTQTIVNAANSIIAKNKGQIQKTVFSDKSEGNRIKVLQATSDIEEGFLVVNNIIAKKTKEQYQYLDFAILYRTNAQSRIFEDVLRKSNIPYKIYGGLSFYQRKEIKDLLAYFRMVINPKDGEALKRVINYPARGIGKTTLDKLDATASHNGVTTWEVLIHPELQSVGFNAGTLKKLQGFVAIIREFSEKARNLDAFALASEIIAQSGILKELHQDNSPENQSRIENIDELLNAIKDFSDGRKESGEENDITHFLEDVALLTDQDNEKDGDKNKVTLMTIHSAKGLEFKNVYIVGLEENLFPSSMTTDSPAGLEEERRLFYVAITRAEEHATLSFARSRFKYGEMNFSQPSRFLGEIDQNYLDVEMSDPRESRRTDFDAGNGSRFGRPLNKPAAFTPRSADFSKTPFGSQTKAPLFSDESFSNQFDVKVGTMVQHERFGIGEVMALEGAAANVKATILFKNAGEKQILLKFAKLKILS